MDRAFIISGVAIIVAAAVALYLIKDTIADSQPAEETRTSGVSPEIARASGAGE
jgi:hypothetical protein